MSVVIHLYILCLLFYLVITQSAGSRTLYHNVSSIRDGGVDGPESHLISHEVDVRGPSPAVGKCVVVSGSAQAALQQHAARAEMVLNLERHTRIHVSLFIIKLLLLQCSHISRSPTRMLLWCLL